MSERFAYHHVVEVIEAGFGNRGQKPLGTEQTSNTCKPDAEMHTQAEQSSQTGQTGRRGNQDSQDKQGGLDWCAGWFVNWVGGMVSARVGEGRCGQVKCVEDEVMVK